MASRRLYSWHELLWGRRVEGVQSFDVAIRYTYRYELELTTHDGQKMRLGSDGMINTWTSPGWASLFGFESDLVREINADVDDFYRVASTIGGYIVFPLNGEGQSGQTINQVRGRHRDIADRFDLTLECIRRHYRARNVGIQDSDSPLAERLHHYHSFFRLFDDFDAYVSFFLLDDLLTPSREVRSLVSGAPLEGFGQPATPTGVEEYGRYRTNCLTFLRARNDRIRRLGL